MTKKMERTVAFGFGVVFICVILASAVVYENPTPYQYTIFRIVLALAASGFATFVPGLIDVEVRPVVRAGGALGVFVIAYFFSPAALNRPPELVFDQATPQQRAFAYRAVFGPPPKDPTPPLHGADFRISRYRDARTGKDLIEVFKNDSVKVVVPFYIDSPCPRPFFESLVFVEAVSKFLTRRVDLIIINMAGEPTAKDLNDFAKSWNLKDSWYFFTGSGSERERVLKGLQQYRAEERDGSGRLTHINYSTITLVFTPDRKPFSIVGDSKIWEPAGDLLYYISHRSPHILDRSVLGGHVPETAFRLVAPAYAAEATSVLQREVQSIRAGREAQLRNLDRPLGCHRAH